MQATNLSVYKFSIYYLSEKAVTLEFGSEIKEDLLHKITSFNTLLNRQPFKGFETSVPAYTTLSIFFDPLQVLKADMPGAGCFQKVSKYLSELSELAVPQTEHPKQTVSIPTCYGGSFGPDLDDVASYCGITTQDVINLHSQAVYTVYMIGFVPGFAYLGGMTALLETPRKATPRQSIPAGSVGIAGKQTGIYPLQTPGGWQLIGQTPLLLFNASKQQPALLKAGDQVRFEPVTPQQFTNYKA
jgi:inhibitor of KinA